MNVAHVQLAAIFLWPGAAEVDHQTAMGVAAARAVRAFVSRVRRGSGVVKMVGDGLNVGIGVRVEVIAGLPEIARALKDVEAMRDDTGFTEKLAVLVVMLNRYCPGGRSNAVNPSAVIEAPTFSHVVPSAAKP